MAQQQQSACCTQLAIASVPMQQWGQTYRPEDAFTRGTIFPQLDMPFTGKNNVEARTTEARMTQQRGNSHE